MKKILLLFAILSIGRMTLAQDTTWVQTYTFDTISTRRATFEFPASLDSKRFEKVLMYYKLKCSPLTTWDQYNCGEWDYLTYTRIFDHTGQMDSVGFNGWKYKVNTASPATFAFKNAAFFNKQYKPFSTRTPAAVTSHTISGASAAPMAFVNQSANGGKIQWIITGSQLAASGAVNGNLQGIQLSFANAVSKLEGVTIRIKHTPLGALSAWETSGFTTVFDNVMTGVSAGMNSFYFSVPFAWDGSSNIVVELSAKDANAAAGMLSLNTTTAAGGITAAYGNLNGTFKTTASNYAELNMSQFDMNGDFTIAFWANGDNVASSNSTVLEAIDSVGNRILNIHFPWTDNTVYFDAGNQNGYDRITKLVTAADVENWHHWAFVKKVSTGQMFIYKDGVLLHSGSNLTRNVGKITRWTLGSSFDQAFNYKGELDEFSVWTTALDASDISGWMNRKIDASHPAYSSLALYYDFDDVLTIADKSGNNHHAMPSDLTMVNHADYAVAGMTTPAAAPVTGFFQGTMNTASSSSVLTTLFPSPKVLFQYEEGENSFDVVNSSIVYEAGTIDTLNADGTVASSGASGTDQVITNSALTYYNEPFEVIHDVEIGRYITPYGIQFDLGPNGFTWIYDVTDYQKYLHGMVDLAAHNTQELLDLKFAFIEGTPPRDVHNVEPVWANWQSYNYGQMAADQVLSAKNVTLSDSSQMFKIKTRLSGHGQVGSAACCEWKDNTHKILINGTERFSWNIWKTNECGENPNTGQGGTWPYAREGWCPGEAVKEHDHEITPYVAPGQQVSIDYDISDVDVSDPDQAGGNYVTAIDLVSYSAPNFQHDAAIVDVLNPNSYELYRKWNPNCSNPRIVLQNTGEQPLTKCIIRLWANYGNWQEFEWTGNLEFLKKEVVEIPLTNENFWYGVDASNAVFHAQVYAVGGYPDLDEYPNNNVFKTSYKVSESVDGPFYVHFKTNNKAAENKWKLIDADGTTIFERTQLANSTDYKDTFNLNPGCYSIILEDSDHDGIGFWYSSQVEGETSGYFRIRKIGSGYIETFPTDFGKYHQWNFTVGYTLGMEEHVMNDENLMIFPNPATEKVRVEYNGELGSDVKVTVTDANGRVLKRQQAEQSGKFAGADIDISDLGRGMYFVTFAGNNGIRMSQFIKQ